MGFYRYRPNICFLILHIFLKRCLPQTLSHETETSRSDEILLQITEISSESDQRRIRFQHQPHQPVNPASLLGATPSDILLILLPLLLNPKDLIKLISQTASSQTPPPPFHSVISSHLPLPVLTATARNLRQIHNSTPPENILNGPTPTTTLYIPTVLRPPWKSLFPLVYSTSNLVLHHRHVPHLPPSPTNISMTYSIHRPLFVKFIENVPYHQTHTVFWTRLICEMITILNH